MPYHLATPQYAYCAAQLCYGVPKVSTLVKKHPVIDYESHSRIVVFCSQNLGHELPAALSITGDNHGPAPLPDSFQLTIFVKGCVGRRRGIRDTQGPVAQTRYRYGPAIPTAKLRLGILEGRADTVLIRQND